MYSSAGYYILGMVMEAAAGPVDHAIKARFFDPLGMPVYLLQNMPARILSNMD